MSLAVYTPTTYVNNTTPALASANLNHNEQGVKAVTDKVIEMESVLVECEVYADNAQTSATQSASSASASEVSAISAQTSAVTAKNEADRAEAIAGYGIATDLIAGFVRGGGEVVVDANGDMTAPGKAPTSHASTATTYGVGSTTNYGHCKTINNVTSSAYVDGESLSAYRGKLLNDSLTNLSSGYVLLNTTTVNTNGL